MKRMVLVDEASLKRPRNSTQSIEKRTLSELDQQMSHILEDTALSDHEKVTSYNQVLQRFLQLKNIGRADPPPPESKPDTDHVINETLIALPKTLREKGKLLLNRLTYNSRGELIQNGQVLIGSNITDLINHALRKTRRSPPRHFEAFTRELREQNAPLELIPNPAPQTPSPKKRISTANRLIQQWSPTF